MGIPKFFRWISERYPLINQIIDRCNPVPHFDCFYLDMNGIIHQCSHNNQAEILVSLKEDEIFNMVCQYVQILFDTVKPQKLLYLAIDGVAPRAKMNQQRQRRYKAAVELTAKLSESPNPPPADTLFDSNCITPGTPFMARLSAHLRHFISHQIAHHPHWASIEVVLSGPEAPGEGEHKILDFLRRRKAQGDWEANLRHCIYGLDADLMMLALCTHELHFALIREEGVLLKKKNGKPTSPQHQSFHLLHISLLREYLDLEFGTFLKGKLKFEYNLENIIDDFILFCFFIGNDFLPSLVGLDIAERSLDELFVMYKDLLPNLDGYLMENGLPVLSRLEKVFAILSNWEKNFFALGPPPDLVDKVSDRILKENKEESALANILYPPGLSPLQRSGDLGGLGGAWFGSGSWGVEDSDEDPELIFKNMYYRPRFKEIENPTFIEDLSKSYIEALFWVSKYYFHGCPSWSWFYPYHYPPLVSDMLSISSISVQFTLDAPLKPLQQLAAVLPPQSARLLPAPYADMITNPDSPLHSFYPETIQIDQNDKKNEWEAIVLLPFINAPLLIEVTSKLEGSLTGEETIRNSFGPPLLFKMCKDPDVPVSMQEFSLPEIPKGVHVFQRLPQAKSGEARVLYLLGRGKMEERDEGFEVVWRDVDGAYEEEMKKNNWTKFLSPTLKSVQIDEAVPAHIYVDVFGSRSQKPSLLIHLKDNYDSRKRETLSGELVGKVGWVWPFNREVLIESLMDSEIEYVFNKPPKKLSEKEIEVYMKKAETLEHKWKESRAIKCYASGIIGVRYSILTKENKKAWSFRPEYIPLSFLLPLPLKECDSFENASEDTEVKRRHHNKSTNRRGSNSKDSPKRPPEPMHIQMKEDKPKSPARPPQSPRRSVGNDQAPTSSGSPHKVIENDGHLEKQLGSGQVKEKIEEHVKSEGTDQQATVQLTDKQKDETTQETTVNQSSQETWSILKKKLPEPEATVIFHPEIHNEEEKQEKVEEGTSTDIPEKSTQNQETWSILKKKINEPETVTFKPDIPQEDKNDKETQQTDHTDKQQENTNQETWSILKKKINEPETLIFKPEITQDTENDKETQQTDHTDKQQEKTNQETWSILKKKINEPETITFKPEITQDTENDKETQQIKDVDSQQDKNTNQETWSIKKKINEPETISFKPEIPQDDKTQLDNQQEKEQDNNQKNSVEGAAAGTTEPSQETWSVLKKRIKEPEETTFSPQESPIPQPTKTQKSSALQIGLIVLALTALWIYLFMIK